MDSKRHNIDSMEASQWTYHLQGGVKCGQRSQMYARSSQIWNFKCTQVLTLEDWEEIMFSTMRSGGGGISFLYFVVWVVVGKFTLLSLFLAVILEAFEIAHERQVAEQVAAIQNDVLFLKAAGTLWTFNLDVLGFGFGEILGYQYTFACHAMIADGGS
jgi:hypothetical protein